SCRAGHAQPADFPPPSIKSWLSSNRGSVHRLRYNRVRVASASFRLNPINLLEMKKSAAGKGETWDEGKPSAIDHSAIHPALAGCSTIRPCVPVLSGKSFSRR